MKKLLIALSVLGVFGLAGFLLKDRIYWWFFRPTQSSLPIGIEDSSELQNEIEVIETDLSVPWGIVELANNDYLISERTGTVHRVSDNKKFQFSNVSTSGEGGLLDIVAHPNFDENGLLYIFITDQESEVFNNRIEQHVFNNDALTFSRVILEDIPGAIYHDGGRMAFGPDNKLYITTGDATEADLAQDTDSLAGKILRINEDGTTPADNPFNNQVYSYGHRNPQGIAWDDKGQLWSSEHGPSGNESGFDELNLIVKGGNYGWPKVRGDETGEDYVAPVAQSGPDETWAPAGLAYSDGSLFFGGLRGESLYQAKINDDNSVQLERHFSESYGRIRTTHISSNGSLLLTTSNTDGRGEPQDQDDKLILFPIAIFFK